MRAAVAAHIHEHLDLLYAGRSYRAYVMRLGAGTPWSVVTLSSNEAGWALHTEWLVLALAALGVHMLVLAALFGLCFFTGHADWLWADPRQARRYSWLSLLVMALLASEVCARLRQQYQCDRRPRSFCRWLPGRSATSWSPPPPRATASRCAKSYADYASLMVLLFLLTAVIPAAGFFTVAYRMQVGPTSNTHSYNWLETFHGAQSV